MIAIVAGTLAVNVLARTANFVKGMGRAKKELGSFQRQAKKGQRDVLGLGASLKSMAGLLSIGAGISFVRRTVADVDDLAKAAEKLGFATDELQFFRFAAERSGTDVGKLDTAIQRMVRRIGEAAEGEGAALKAFHRMGINVRSLIKMRPADQFRLILTELGKIPNVNERINRTNKFFDSEGVDLVRLATANLQELGVDFDAFVTRVGDLDADKMERVADSFTNLAESVKGLGRGFLIDVSDEVLPLIEAIQEMQRQSARRRQGSRQFNRMMMFGGTAGFGAMREVMKDVQRTIDFRELVAPGTIRSGKRTEALERERLRLIEGRPELGPNLDRAMDMQRLTKSVDRLNGTMQRQDPGTFN